MNAEMEKIKKLWAKVLGSMHMQSMSYERTGIMPKRDWLVMLVVTAVVACGLGAVSYVLYTRVNAGTLFPVPANDTSTQVTINAQLLKTTVDTLSTRQATSTQLDQATTTPADPSL